MLRLDVALPDRPDEFLPRLDNDALREDGPEATMLVGDSALELTLLGEPARAPRRRSGISTHTQRGTRERGTIRPFVNHTLRKTEPCKELRTTLYFVRLGIVSDVRRLGFCYLHETIFLYLRQSNVGFVPL